MEWDVVVIGGGPAGLSAAVAAAEAGARALVLEHLPKPGRKLLASGGGACNLTHGGEIADFLPHYEGGDRPGDAGRFLRPALYAFSNAALSRYCAASRVPLVEEGDGRVFPSSRRAQDVVDLLLTEVRRRRVETRAGIAARYVKVEREGFAAMDRARAVVVRGRTLVLATGGRSYPSLGATGDGYRLTTSLGHTIVPPRPALVPVVVERKAFSTFVPCAGVTLPGAAVAVVREGRPIAAKNGDVLLTHRGLSGPAVLDLSRHVLPGDVLRVSLLPGLGDVRAAERKLVDEIGAHGKRTAMNLLQGLGVTGCLARAVVGAVGLDPGVKVAEVSRDARRALATALASGGDGGHPFPVRSLGGWNEAMVTAGGVLLSEVDPKTMGSRLVPGLFFAGEILDVDGDTGGYNLQAAFSTGRLAGLSAAHFACGSSGSSHH